MDLIAFMKKYSDEIGGQYTDYNESVSVIIIPLSGGRFQTVIGSKKQNELYNRQMITFTSKVCAYQPSIDLAMLLEQATYFNYCRFVIKEGYVQVEAISPVASVSEDGIKEMLQEVANLADQYEMKLTGADIN